MLMKQKIISLVVTTAIAIGNGLVNARPVGFSYAKFSGPVSGPEKEIYFKDAHGHGRVDYIAKPDYSFSYGVDDPKTRVLQNRKEIRNGDAVRGEYSVVDPDGTLRVVKYTADKINGFQAEVITDGKSEIHGHDVSHNPQHHHQNHHPNHHTNYNQNYNDGQSVSYGTHQQHHNPGYRQEQTYANSEDDDGGDDDEDGDASGGSGEESSENNDDDY